MVCRRRCCRRSSHLLLSLPSPGFSAASALKLPATAAGVLCLLRCPDTQSKRRCSICARPPAFPQAAADPGRKAVPSGRCGLRPGRRSGRPLRTAAWTQIPQATGRSGLKNSGTAPAVRGRWQYQENQAIPGTLQGRRAGPAREAVTIPAGLVSGKTGSKAKAGRGTGDRRKTGRTEGKPADKPERTCGSSAKGKERAGKCPGQGKIRKVRHCQRKHRHKKRGPLNNRPPPKSSGSAKVRPKLKNSGPCYGRYAGCP